jgi:hypothetical protein
VHRPTAATATAVHVTLPGILPSVPYASNKFAAARVDTTNNNTDWTKKKQSHA